MCGCAKLNYTGGCGCGGHKSSYTGSDLPIGGGSPDSFRVLTPQEAMKLVEDYKVSPAELDGLTAEEAAQLKVDRYAKMRVWLEENGLELTTTNVMAYNPAAAEAGHQVTKAWLKTGGTLLGLLVLTLGLLLYLTKSEG